MDTLTSTEEGKLLEGVKLAVDLVDNEGMSPTDALTKVSRDMKWNPGSVRSAVNAFNNGRQVAQWNANSNVLDKLAEFPLADYDDIVSAIWGKTAEKTACDSRISDEYAQAPSWLRNERRQSALNYVLPGATEKTASDNPIINEHNSQRAAIAAWTNHDNARKAFEGTRAKYAQAHDSVRVQLMLLENYFKKSAMDRLSFAVVEDAAGTYHGQAGRSLFNVLAASFPKEKRAADSRLFYDGPIHRDTTPFTTIKAAIDSAKAVGAAKKAMDEAFAEMQKAAETLRPFAQSPSSNPSEPVAISNCLLSEKTADGVLSGAAGGFAVKSLMERAMKSTDAGPKVESAYNDLDDPDHDNELRKIRVEAMLNGLMSDPDSPISGFSPDQVLSGYNELAQLAPRASEQPAAMRTLLSKQLSGHMEPFEVQESLNIEKGLKDAKQSPAGGSLLDSSKSIMG